MATPTFGLPEILAMLQVVGAPARTIEKFTAQAEHVVKNRQTNTDDENNFEVGSGYSSATRRDHVKFKAGGLEWQLDPRKAKQIALWLLESAEAAVSDHCVMELLQSRIGITDPQALGKILIDLREIRQGTRDVKYQA